MPCWPVVMRPRHCGRVVPATQLGHTLDKTQADRDVLACVVSLVLGRQWGRE